MTQEDYENILEKCFTVLYQKLARIQPSSEQEEQLGFLFQLIGALLLMSKKGEITEFWESLDENELPYELNNVMFLAKKLNFEFNEFDFMVQYQASVQKAMDQQETKERQELHVSIWSEIGSNRYGASNFVELTDLDISDKSAANFKLH